MSSRFHTTLILLFFCAGIAYGQAVVLATSTNSGIEYLSEAGPAVRVFAGLSIPISGRLKLEAGRTVDLALAGRKVRLSGPQEVDMAKMAADARKEKSASFIGRFFSFLSSSVTNTGTAQDVENYHRRYITNTKAGIKGYGKEGETIWVAGEFRQVISSNPSPLRWDSVTGASAYLVKIVAMETEEQVLLSVVAKTNELNLPLSQLPLAPKTVYQLIISTIGTENTITTPDLFFRFDPATVAAFREKVRAKPLFQELDEVERSLFLAQQLEEKGYFQAARQDYEALLATDPDNQLYRKVFAAFLIRINELETAKALLNKIMQ